MEVLINGELVLNGTVGNLWFEDGFTYTDVIMALVSMSGDITVRLNSGGGIATEGIAIYNALAQHKGKKTVFVEGIAASAASIIAMAGDEIVMNEGTIMMIHDPMTFADGNADEMSKVIEALNALGDSMASIYAAKTGRSSEDIRAEMREEIWLTANDAVAKGYATKVAKNAAQEIVAFDYRAYINAPQNIVAMSDQRKWSNRLAEAKASKVTKKQETKAMTEVAPANSPVPADVAVKAEQDRILAIMTACTTAGVPTMAGALIREGVTAEQAQARIVAEGERVKTIRAKVEQARKIAPVIEANIAETFIAAGSSPEAVADDLLNRIASISAAAPQRASNTITAPNDQVQTTAAWDKIVARINTQRGLNS